MSLVGLLTLERKTSSEKKNLPSTGRQICVLPNNEAGSELDTLHTCHTTVPQWPHVIVSHNCAHHSYSTPLERSISTLLVMQLNICTFILGLRSNYR